MSFIFTGASKLYFRNKIIRAKKLNSQPDNDCGVVMIIVMDRWTDEASKEMDEEEEKEVMLKWQCRVD